MYDAYINTRSILILDGVYDGDTLTILTSLFL
jgi:hypothetical protein